jgi:hypothetical protein
VKSLEINIRFIQINGFVEMSKLTRIVKDADYKVDYAHWSKFEGFREFQHKFLSKVEKMDVSTSDFLFMRWKVYNLALQSLFYPMEGMFSNTRS